MNIEPLKKIGLSEGEIQVYLTLLKLGLVTAGPIIKETGLQSSSVYHILDSLIKKGVISFEIKNKRKYFCSVSPERLLDFLSEKKEKIEQEKAEISKLMPQLIFLKELAVKPQQETLIFEGWNGVLSAFKEVYNQLKQGTTTYAYVITKEFGGADKEQVKWLINKIILLREEINKKHKDKVKMKVISERDSEIGKMQSKSPNTNVRFIEENFTNPAVINIYGDVTIIALWLKKPIAFYILSKEVSNSFRNNFELLWKLAKK